MSEAQEFEVIQEPKLTDKQFEQIYRYFEQKGDGLTRVKKPNIKGVIIRSSFTRTMGRKYGFVWQPKKKNIVMRRRAYGFAPSEV